MNIFVQARMTSERLPGKVLKDLCGKFILQHITDRISKKFGKNSLVILTSNDISDLPIVKFAEEHNLKIFRGSLENVYDRFKNAIKKYEPDYFVRVCGDSPLIDMGLIEEAIKIFQNSNTDLVTNTFPRSFPKGQSVEVIRSSTFINSEYTKSSSHSKEHVTSSFYSDEKKYNIINIESTSLNSEIDFAVDSKEDFLKIEKYLKKNNFDYPSFSPDKFKIINNISKND